MKKSLIALAVAGALTAPMVAQADATLYGSIRVLVTDVDGNSLDVADGTSRIGLKGNVDLGIDGVKGVYQFETRLRADEGTFAGNDARLSYVGATGGFGTALAGRMYSPHWLWTSAIADTMFNDASFATIRESVLRVPNTVAYISPKFGGVQVAAAAIMAGGASATSEDVDVHNLAVKYAAGGLHLGASITTANNKGAADTDNVGLAASYTMGGVKVFGRYQEEENAGFGGTNDFETKQLGATYKMGATTLAARWTNLDDGNNDGDQIAVGVTQALGKQGRVFLEYAAMDSDWENGFAAGTLLGTASRTADTLSIGYRLDF